MDEFILLTFPDHPFLVHGLTLNKWQWWNNFSRFSWRKSQLWRMGLHIGVFSTCKFSSPEGQSTKPHISCVSKPGFYYYIVIIWTGAANMSNDCNLMLFSWRALGMVDSLHALPWRVSLAVHCLTRDHWGGENGLQWRLDCHFRNKIMWSLKWGRNSWACLQWT